MKTKVLIADDEAHMRRVIELSLFRGGYDLLFARDGRAAVEIARREQPALVVLDVNMPVLDGVGALRELKHDPATADIPVIMLTARGHVLTRQEAETSGAARFLTKPFSPTQLLQEVQRLLALPVLSPAP